MQINLSDIQNENEYNKGIQRKHVRPTIMSKINNGNKTRQQTKPLKLL